MGDKECEAVEDRVYTAGAIDIKKLTIEFHKAFLKDQNHIILHLKKVMTKFSFRGLWDVWFGIWKRVGTQNSRLCMKVEDETLTFLVKKLGLLGSDPDPKAANGLLCCIWTLSQTGE